MGLGALYQERNGEKEKARLATGIPSTLLALHGNRETLAGTARSQCLLKVERRMELGHFVGKKVRVKERVGEKEFEELWGQKGSCSLPDTRPLRIGFSTAGDYLSARHC